jgi:6,7-dimethyl-8-ribityllumazine synthase
MNSDRHSSVPVIPGARPRVLIIEARFYDDIADHLLAGARAVLEVAGAEVDIITVPGALEIPAAVSMAQRAPHEVAGFAAYDGYVALGCVIRGETSHYDIVAGESNRALMDLATRDGLALGNGILTVENLAQAMERAKPADMDKGGGAARACLVMIATQRRFGLPPVPADPFAAYDDEDDTPDAKSMLDDILGKRSKR